MKVGDTVPVNIGHHTVAQAQVKSVDTKENTATLVVPATLVVMGIRTELTDLPSAESATETLITGVEAPTEPEESATVGEPIDTNTSNVSGSENVGVVEGTAAEPVADGAGNVSEDEGAVPGQQITMMLRVKPKRPSLKDCYEQRVHHTRSRD